jgi:alpha-tubulin suppressor-like RCC1 family protein
MHPYFVIHLFCFSLCVVQSPTLKALNMYFWGAEEGRGNTLGDNQEVPQEIKGEITDVSAGSRHVFLIEEDGTAQAAGFIESGAGYRGHLGLGPADTGCEDRDFLRKLCEGRNVPLPVTTVFNADGEKVDAPPFRHAYAGVGVASDSGAMHALLISEDGKAYVSGNNNKGQLCLGNKDPTDFFHEVKGIDNVVHGAVGEEFTLLVTESGKVYGCGSNEVGQLGDEPLDLSLSTSPIEIKGGLNGITDVATGLGFALYLNGDTGEIWGSGSNIYGQLCGFTEGTPTTLPKVRSKFVEQLMGYNTIGTRDYLCLPLCEMHISDSF